MGIAKLVIKNYIKASDQVGEYIADLIAYNSEYLAEHIANILLTNNIYKFKYGDYVKFKPKSYIINNNFIISDLKDHNLYNDGYVYAQIIDRDWINGSSLGSFVKCKMIFNTKSEITDLLPVFSLLSVDQKIIPFLKSKI